MPSDYKTIAEENVLDYGRKLEEWAPEIFSGLYSERTHFIYELLQNAEDAEAETVVFDLYPDRLEMHHDGKIALDEFHVRGICGLGLGAKKTDLTKIGKFGIGFKSVYAYTSTPHVYSAEEAFCIEGLVKPKAVPRIHVSPDETRFVLPFNHKNVSPKEAFNAISNRLSNLGPRSILFLRHISEITWNFSDGQKINEGGYYLRETKESDKQLRTATITIERNGSSLKENWLIFSRPIKWGDLPPDCLFVEIAYQCKRDESIGKECITPISDSKLIVFFPTEKETRFKFLVQGLYRTTPTREEIPKDDDWNKHLIRETAVLITETLLRIKKMGLLNVNFLEVLPIRYDDFLEEGMFRPIYDSVLETFLEHLLLPTDKSDFVTAKHALLARGSDLRKLLDTRQLQQLYSSDDTLQWLSGEITENSPPDLWNYLTDKLDIDVIDPDAFARKITNSFLEKQTDDWIAEFYGYLIGQEALWRPARHSLDSPGLLRNKEIIRLDDNQHVRPFKLDGRPNAFLPTDGASGYPVVKPTITKNERAVEFLKKLGIHEVGEREAIETILKSYYAKDSPDPTANDHIQHMKRFVAWHHKGGDKTIFAGYYLFLDEEQKNFYTPDSCFLDLPFKDTGLRCLFEPDSQGERETEKAPLWKEYKEIEDFAEFAVSLGVIDGLKIVNKTTWDNPAKAYLHIDYYAKHTYTKIDDDYSIDHLDDLLSRKNINISKLIWTTLRGADPIVLTARFRPNQQYTTRTAPSLLVSTLKKYDWIPDRNGFFHIPAKITRSVLPDGFIYDDRNGWLSAIGFGSEAQETVKGNEEKQKHAQALGIKNLETIEIIREIEENPDLLFKVRSVIDAERKAVLFPIRQSQNPERREHRIVEDIQGAPGKIYEPRERSIRISLPSKQDKETFLRESYTNSDDQMVCQICKKEMPFRKRDGNYYFEAVEVLSDQDIEHEALYIALCPLCAAMYKEFVKRDPNSMSRLKESIITAEEPEIPVYLGPLQTTIKFVETHFLDLKTIIKEMDRT